MEFANFNGDTENNEVPRIICINLNMVEFNETGTISLKPDPVPISSLNCNVSCMFGFR
jgi:hypothetical protein